MKYPIYKIDCFSILKLAQNLNLMKSDEDWKKYFLNKVKCFDRWQSTKRLNNKLFQRQSSK